jgi:hypothetical protein
MIWIGKIELETETLLVMLPLRVRPGLARVGLAQRQWWRAAVRWPARRGGWGGGGGTSSVVEELEGRWCGGRGLEGDGEG